MTLHRRISSACTSLLSVLGLAACTAQTQPEPSLPPEPAPADCGASQLGGYVGHTASDEVLAAIRGWRGDKPLRVLKPGSAMTMDYRPERLNIFLDNDGVITKFECN